MLWFELFFWAFSFSYRSSDCKNYCCALKAYEITLLSKLPGFFFKTKFLIIDHTSHL